MQEIRCCEATYPDCNALAKQKLPILLTLSGEECRGNQQCTCEGQWQFDVAHVEDSTGEQAGDENESILDVRALVSIRSVG